MVTYKWINVYEVGERFGGHEEGGWTYKCGRLTEAMSFLCCDLVPHADDCVANNVREQKLFELSRPLDWTAEYVYVPEGEDAPPEFAGELMRQGIEVKFESRKGRDYPESRPYYQ